jgi:predicted ATPase
MSSLAEVETLVNNASVRRTVLLEQVSKAQDTAQTLTVRMQFLEEAQAFLIKVAQDTQNQLRFHIQDIVQQALDLCFPGEYQFQVSFEVKRGVTTGELFFLKNGQPVNPMDAAGGGVVDVASFALRIAAWALSRDRNVIVLDEPFRFLSKDLQPRAGQLMQALSEQLGLQIIMVTHEEAMVDVADRVFRVSKIDGRSKVVVHD